MILECIDTHLGVETNRIEEDVKEWIYVCNLSQRWEHELLQLVVAVLIEVDLLQDLIQVKILVLHFRKKKINPKFSCFILVYFTIKSLGIFTEFVFGLW